MRLRRWLAPANPEAEPASFAEVATKAESVRNGAGCADKLSA